MAKLIFEFRRRFLSSELSITEIVGNIIDVSKKPKSKESITIRIGVFANNLKNPSKLNKGIVSIIVFFLPIRSDSEEKNKPPNARPQE